MNPFLLSALCASLVHTSVGIAPSPHITLSAPIQKSKATSKIERIKSQIKRAQNASDAYDAAEKLVEIGPDSIPYVIAALAKPNDLDMVNSALAYSLADYGPIAKRPMLNALANGNALQREAIILCFHFMAEQVTLRAPRQQTALIERLYTEGREASAKRWRYLYEEDVIRGLRKALDLPDGTAAGMAAEILGYLGAKEAMLDLVVKTEAKDTLLATGAFEGLVSMLGLDDAEAARQAFATVLENSADEEDAETRLDLMVKTLARSRTEVGQEVLHNLLKSPTEEVRIEALRAYQIRQEEGALELVKPLLEDESIGVRRMALAAIGNLGQGEVEFDRMVASVRSSNEYDRAWGAYALGLTRKPESLSILLPLVDAKEDRVRELLAMGLMNWKDPKAKGALKKLAKDPVERVRDAAEKSLLDSDD
jgi:HEAT repeat protein